MTANDSSGKYAVSFGLSVITMQQPLCNRQSCASVVGMEMSRGQGIHCGVDRRVAGSSMSPLMCVDALCGGHAYE